MADVRRGRVNVIVCFKLDRLGRSLPHLAQIVSELTAHRLALVCPSQGIDTTTTNPASQLQLNILMAIAEFERASKADPDWPVAQGNLATLLFETGKIEAARPAFERWAKVEPDSVEPHLGLGLISQMLKKSDEAVGHFQEVLRRDPVNFRAHVALGETLMRQGKLEEAQRHLERAAQIEKDIPRIYEDLGRIYEQRGLKQLAEQARAKSRALSGGER
jgi:predicted Zn-dependent protease